jgi:hypothetical protein
MTLFELAILVGAVGGIAAGVALGFDRYGLLGGIIGAPIGLVVGPVSAVLLVLAPFGLGIAWERYQARRALRPHFGRFWAAKRQADWEELSRHTELGRAVSGRVVVLFYYGAFLDVGCGFPALIASSELSPGGGYGKSVPTVGSVLSARVHSLEKGSRYVRLSFEGNDVSQPDAAVSEEPRDDTVVD